MYLIIGIIFCTISIHQSAVVENGTKTGTITLNLQDASLIFQNTSELINIQISESYIRNGNFSNSDSGKNETSEASIKPAKKIGNRVYSKTELQALDKFRPLVLHLIKREDDKNDGYLMKWLRARDMNVQKAYEMYTEFLRWRKDLKVDEILEEGAILELDPQPYVKDGYDREGFPLILLNPTAVDLRKLALQGNLPKFYRYAIQVFEQALKSGRVSSLASGKGISQFTATLDFHGFNLRQHACLSCIPMFRDMLLAFENYYPGYLRHIIGVNVPRIGLPLIEILKPLMSPNTLKVFKFFGTNRMEWTAYLQTIVAPDQLPYRFGGTKKT